MQYFACACRVDYQFRRLALAYLLSLQLSRHLQSRVNKHHDVCLRLAVVAVLGHHMEVVVRRHWGDIHSCACLAEARVHIAPLHVRLDLRHVCRYIERYVYLLVVSVHHLVRLLVRVLVHHRVRLHLQRVAKRDLAVEAAAR